MYFIYATKYVTESSLLLQDFDNACFGVVFFFKYCIYLTRGFLAQRIVIVTKMPWKKLQGKKSKHFQNICFGTGCEILFVYPCRTWQCLKSCTQ